MQIANHNITKQLSQHSIATKKQNTNKYKNPIKGKFPKHKQSQNHKKKKNQILDYTQKFKNPNGRKNFKN